MSADTYTRIRPRVAPPLDLPRSIYKEHEMEFRDRLVIADLYACWEVANKGVRGAHSHYPKFGFDGWTMSAHRFAYLLWCGPIPSADLHVLHRCDFKPCCNPSHLWLGTHQENMADKIAKGRDARGERQGGHKLTDDGVREIRRRSKAGEPRTTLAQEFGVSATAISYAARGKTWAATI